MKIGLFTSVYFNNIGNAFIDLGAEATINEAKPADAEIVKVSQCANFAATMGRTFLFKENPIINWLWVRVMQKFAKKLHDRSYKSVKTMDVFSVANIAKFDYFIIPGCVLTVPFFKIYGELLRNKVKQGCKLIFLAASGNHYTDYEVNYVSEFLKELKPYAIMTRDSVAYKHYAKFSENTYNGIDNVFFVNRLDIPKCETTVSPYIVLNFDEPKHNGIKELLAKKFADKNIIYTNHKPFPYANVSKLVKKGIMVSDYPLDYLLLYKNVTETHSDRVHACIPTLSFGNKAQLYSDSPRSALFENVGITDIKDHPVKVEGLKEMQDKQICFLKRILI
ncbi:polysaccharide pyruvyl transferase family protein [uncultured Bacteroides sp.]|uniref:polysaccharide pyruvyl transferase family protein n=1 Tax=uncultured Bacteroides sp. TaxID=162156 RepID=UPI0026358AB8|nr:polysaccharide pyruvyl transferase family protein [uncultured Bacteroides sp.]